MDFLLILLLSLVVPSSLLKKKLVAYIFLAKEIIAENFISI